MVSVVSHAHRAVTTVLQGLRPNLQEVSQGAETCRVPGRGMGALRPVQSARPPLEKIDRMGVANQEDTAQRKRNVSLFLQGVRAKRRRSLGDNLKRSP